MRKDGEPAPEDAERLTLKIAAYSANSPSAPVRRHSVAFSDDAGSLDYARRHHSGPNHQGLGNHPIESPNETGHARLACRQRLGGLLRDYHRRAA
jgi:hypothetical protein